MLALEIAGGIVLAVVVLRFWRQSLWIAGGSLALLMIAILLLWMDARGWVGWEDIGVTGAVVFTLGVIRAWAERSNHPIARWVDREMNKSNRAP